MIQFNHANKQKWLCFVRLVWAVPYTVQMWISISFSLKLIHFTFGGKALLNSPKAELFTLKTIKQNELSLLDEPVLHFFNTSIEIEIYE